MLDDIEAERARLDRILSAGLENEADRGLRQAIEDRGTDRHEAEGYPVVDVGADGDHVGNGQANLATGQIGEYDNEILQHQDRHECGQSKIRTANAQRRQCQDQSGQHGCGRPRDNAEIDRQPILIVQDSGGVGADADQEGGAEIDFAGKAEQQVPCHGEHAKIVGNRQQPENVTGDIERQCRRRHHHGESDPQRPRFEDIAHAHRLPSRPCGRMYMTMTSSSSAGIVR